MVKVITSLGIEIGVSLLVGSLLAGVISHTGKLVSAQNKALTMVVDEDNSTHTFEVADGASILRNGRTATLEDLVPGDALRITTDAAQNVTSVDATSASGSSGRRDDPSSTLR